MLSIRYHQSMATFFSKDLCGDKLLLYANISHSLNRSRSISYLYILQTQGITYYV